MSGDECAPWGVGTVAHGDKRIRGSWEWGGEGYKRDVEMGERKRGNNNSVGASESREDDNRGHCSI